MFKFAILLLYFAPGFNSQKMDSTDVNRCPSKYGDLPIHTYIEGCSTPPCPVISGEHVTINVVFKVPRTLRRMETKAYVPSYNIHFPLLGDSVTCNFLSNTYCPVLKDEVVQYTLRMFILPRLSAITLEIYFYVADENQQPIWCISVGIAVQSPTNNINIQNSTLIN